jgi:2-alkyl-3-oxoalkanoate reductase
VKLLVTGAGGFLGRAIVDAAVAAGHDVTAMVRDGSRRDSGAERGVPPEVRLLVGDLRSRGDWCDGIGAAEVVVHAAAAAGGERGLQLANTVVGTENLLGALEGSSVSRIVLVSSFSVYDFAGIPRGRALTEESPLEERPLERDPYTETKLVQERLVRRWCADHDVPLVVLRPGAIAGPGRTWGYGTALNLGGLSFVFAPRARFRIIDVANCAAAIVRAAETPDADGTTINLVDDELPTHAEFFRRCRAAGAGVGTFVPVPWLLVSAVGRTLDTLNRRAFNGRMKLPELLDHRRQQARWKPLRYPNHRARHVLGWRPERTTAETIRTLVQPEVRP